MFGDLRQRLLSWPRTTKISFYDKAFREAEDAETVAQEFLPLVMLAVRDERREWIPEVVLGPATKSTIYGSKKDIIESAEVEVTRAGAA
jgi:hypothetical protein